MDDDSVLDHGPDPARRDAALAATAERFDAVAARFAAVYGLRLPRHLAVFAAFFDSLGATGRDVVGDELGLRTGGVTDYFAPDGLALTGRDGLDERLESRFRCDPPEFVTFMYGDTDGLHYGLWYDDPAELPSLVAYNYARDSAETWTDGLLTPLAQVARRIEDLDEEADDEPDDDPDGARQRAAVRLHLQAFLGADQQACAQDGPARWAHTARPDILASPGPALPADAGDPRGGRRHHEQRYQGYRARSPEVRDWIALAERELAAGQPAYALVLGRELHWFDAEDYRADALRLMTAAYRALGRDALAEIATVHHAHRDLRSVAVLTR